MTANSSASAGTLPAKESPRGTDNPAIGPQFVVKALVLSVLFFGLLRVGWIQKHILMPFTGFQEFLACQIGGDPDAPVRVTLSCSGADVIALCLGFILAFPVKLSSRLKGALLGLLLISAVNTVRIAILTRVARTSWFQPMHVYILPGILLLAVSLYVFLWMSATLGVASGERKRSLWERVKTTSPTARRFVVWTFVFVLLYFASAGWWMDSDAIEVVAKWITATGAAVIGLFGGEATASGIILRTANGGFAVTQECIFSPLIPVYFAAALALPMAPWKRILALLGSFPVFFMLGSARLLVLAVPKRLVGSHSFAIHGFHQLVAGVLLVVLAAWLWSRGREQMPSSVGRRIGAALAAGLGFGLLLGRFYTLAVMGSADFIRGAMGHAGHSFIDNQGAALMMPAYQVALFLALWIALGARLNWSRLGLSVAVLFATQVALVFLLGELSQHLDFRPHVALVRAWGVLLPVALAWFSGRGGDPAAAPRATPVSEHA